MSATCVSCGDLMDDHYMCVTCLDEMKRKAEAFPDMLAALEIAHKLLMADLYREAEEAIEEAIAKAKVKP